MKNTLFFVFYSDINKDQVTCKYEFNFMFSSHIVESMSLKVHKDI